MRKILQTGATDPSTRDSRLGILQKPVSTRGGVGCSSNQLQEVEEMETDLVVVDLGGQCRRCFGASCVHDVLPIVAVGEGDGCHSAEVSAFDGCQHHLVRLGGREGDVGKEGRKGFLEVPVCRDRLDRPLHNC